MKELRKLGSEVIYRGVDITDLGAVDRTIAEIARLCGRVDVFVHGAGIDISRSLSSKTMDQIRLVFDVKVKGARNILVSLERLQLPVRRIIGFGSVAVDLAMLPRLTIQRPMTRSRTCCADWTETTTSGRP